MNLTTLSFANVQVHVLLLAIAVGILSAARLTRLITEDSFPPSAWLRAKWDAKFENGSWGVLAHCPWCAAPYLAAAVLAWGVLSDLGWHWWVFNGWLAGSYIASWIVFHDEDGS